MELDDFSEGCAWVEGRYVPVGQATISLLDAGFARSDVTYDVVGVWDGAFFRLDDHLDRFERSWTKLHMNPPVSKAEMREILFECVKRSGIREAYVDMIVTRGVPRAGNRDPRTFANRFYAYAIPYVWIVKPDDQMTGTHVIVAREHHAHTAGVGRSDREELPLGRPQPRVCSKPTNVARTRPCCPTGRATSPKAPATTCSCSATAN